MVDSFLISRVTVAFPGTVVQLQHGLGELARQSVDFPPDMRDSAILRSAVELLEASLTLACAGHATRSTPASREELEAEFEALADDLRNRFEEEGLRADEQGLRETPSPGPAETPPSATDRIVVSLVAAQRAGEGTATASLPSDNTLESLRNQLRQLASLTPAQLLAIEVIWDPVDPDERLAAAELQAQYPELGSWV